MRQRGRVAGLSLVASACVLVGGTSVALADGSSTATLKVRFDQPPSASATRVLELRAEGTPPSHPIEFVDPSGAHEVTGEVWISTKSKPCPHARVVHTGLGETPWCLKVRKLPTGVSLTGRIAGAKLVVTVTLNSRDSLVWPVIATICALLLAVALLYIVTYGLPSLVPRFQLRQRLSRDRDKIAGLDAWVAEAEAHSTIADVAAQERSMRRAGIAHVRKVRVRLKSALEGGDAIPADAPLYIEGMEEARISSSTPVPASDMLSPDGKRAVSHAEMLLVTVVRARKFIEEWKQQVKALEIRHESYGREGSPLLKEGLEALHALSPWTIDEIESSLRRKLIEAQTPEQPMLRLAALEFMHSGHSELALTDLRIPQRLAPVSVRVARSVQRLVSIADIFAAGAATLIAVIALVLVASATALVANYASNDTFGSFADYAKLMTSTFGSASVATLLGVGLLWTKIRSWKG